MFHEPGSKVHYAWVIVAAAFSMLVVSGGMISAMGVFAVFFGIGFGGGFPTYPVISREYFGVTRLGAVFGLQLAGSMTGMALGGYLGGALHDLTGSYTSAFLISLTTGIASIVLAACLRRPRGTPDLIAAEPVADRGSLRGVLVLQRPGVFSADHA